MPLSEIDKVSGELEPEIFLIISESLFPLVGKRVRAGEQQLPSNLVTEGMVIMQYKLYIPRDAGELLAYLAHMMLASPTFKGTTGYFPQENIDSAFFGLNEGLMVVRRELGEEHNAALKAMSE